VAACRGGRGLTEATLLAGWGHAISFVDHGDRDVVVQRVGVKAAEAECRAKAGISPEQRRPVSKSRIARLGIHAVVARGAWRARSCRSRCALIRVVLDQRRSFTDGSGRTATRS
jgi:hypothetical protein